MARTVTFTMFELFIFERDVGPVSKVWTERELIEEAAYEFAQVIKIALQVFNLCLIKKIFCVR